MKLVGKKDLGVGRESWMAQSRSSAAGVLWKCCMRWQSRNLFVAELIEVADV